MLRINYAKNISNPPSGMVRYVEGACLSGDEKPTEGIATGSLILEVDTKKLYVYDEESTWSELCSLQE